MLYSGTTPGLVATGDLDIGFSRLPVTQPGVEWRIVGYERLLAALPVDHRLARRETVAMRDLAKEPWVAFPAGKGSTVRDAGLLLAHEQGLLPRIVQEAPDSYAILALVAAGVGVTLTVSSVGHISNPGLVYRELAGEPAYLATVILWGPRPGRATRRVLEILERLLPTPPPPEGRVLG